MFSMKVTDSISQNNINAVSGICKNIHEFSGSLQDETGNNYVAVMAMGKDLIVGNPIKIFRLFGDVDVMSLKNQTLIGA